MTPTIGRIVHFTFGADPPIARAGCSIIVPAIIVSVLSETRVNLRVFQDGDSNPLWRTNVERKDVASDGADYWEWPEIKRAELSGPEPEQFIA